MFHSRKYLVGCFITLCGITFVQIQGGKTSEHLSVKLDRVEQEYNKDLLTFNVHLDSNTGLLNLDAEVKKEIVNPVMSAYFAMLTNTGEYDMVLLNATHDFCKFLENRKDEPLLDLIYTNILKHGNFITSCPVKQGSYHLKDFTIDVDKYPAFMPATKFMLRLAMLTENRNDFSFTAYGTVTKIK